jgi:hypothetical protein
MGIQLMSDLRYTTNQILSRKFDMPYVPAVARALEYMKV